VVIPDNQLISRVSEADSREHAQKSSLGNPELLFAFSLLYDLPYIGICIRSENAIAYLRYREYDALKKMRKAGKEYGDGL
jgi:hypothetical protein